MRSARRPSVLLLDGARKPGAKILVSGGSRCNVTNASVTPADFWTTGSTAVVRRILRAFPVSETVDWFRDLGVALHEEAQGKLFPDSQRARDVLDALLGAAHQHGAKLATEARAERVGYTDGGFTVVTQRGELRARALVLATGGQSLPKSGSDGGGYRLAAMLGHYIVPTTPALAPLVLMADTREPSLHRQLTGVAHDVGLTVWVDGAVHVRFNGALLWTHFGVSGPVALNASRHIERARLDGRAVRVTIALLEGRTFEQVSHYLTEVSREHPRQALATALSYAMPAAVAEAILERMQFAPQHRVSQLSRADRLRLAHALSAWELPVAGTRGYSFAEATAGGVDLSEVDPGTMQSRRCPGLYLVGELLDVDGRLGGYNFQWAWCTARVAGLALGKSWHARWEGAGEAERGTAAG